jgi:DNA/RNA-binding domain of Phe-tRNA-synthetase-like protein
MSTKEYILDLDPGLDPSPVLPAMIWAEGIAPPSPTNEVPAFLAEIITRVEMAGEEFVPATVRARVRKMLRYGKYKPSGRGKPASEFLLRAALNGSFPLVNGPVDVNNAVSLESGLPGTIFDAALSGTHLLLRRGKPGESYVFNRSGQTIDLQDLLLLCRRIEGSWEPCGNPVKDAMTTKINENTGSVIAVLYAPADESVTSVEGWAERYANLLKTHCQAETVGFKVVTV